MANLEIIKKEKKIRKNGLIILFKLNEIFFLLPVQHPVVKNDEHHEGLKDTGEQTWNTRGAFRSTVNRFATILAPGPISSGIGVKLIKTGCARQNEQEKSPITKKFSFFGKMKHNLP